MANNCQPTRKRSEILFDNLKENDPTNGYSQNRPDELSNVSDRCNVKTELCENEENCKESMEIEHQTIQSAIKDENKENCKKSIKLEYQTIQSAIKDESKEKFKESMELDYHTVPSVIKDENKENVVSNKLNSVSIEYKGLFEELDNQIPIEELCKNLLKENELPKRSMRTLSLAVLSRSQLNEKECESVFEVLNAISDHRHSYALTFCQSLLLYMLTKQKLSLDQFAILERHILAVAHSLIHEEESYKVGFVEARIVLLGGECYLAASKLCEEIFIDQNIVINSLDVKTICCAALKSLSNVRTVSIGLNKFSDSTLKYIISMIGISTQEIVLENLVDTEEEEIISISSYIVNQCLQVLEQILSVDPSSPCKTLDHEDFSLLRCLTKLLEWSVSSLFPQQTSDNCLFRVQTATQSFYLSTLVSILKVFSILSFHPDQYDYFTNIKGSMEKIMICILKIYFQSKDKHFDILVLALEMMINFSFKCKKVFVLLCLKKFQINTSEEVLAIEALLKILNSSLEKITAIKSMAMTKASENESNPEKQEGASKEQEHDMELILKAADEDMELSTIVSFVGILLMLFIDTKKSFFEFVQERLSVEKCTEVIEVSKKFLQFAIMTGGMPATGVLLLRAAIKKLSELHQSSS